MLNSQNIFDFQKKKIGQPDQKKRHYLIDLNKWAGTKTIRDGLAPGTGV